MAKDVEWDRLMIGMLQNPTIMDFAQFLNSVQIGTSHEENEISETPLNIIADIPEGGEVMKFSSRVELASFSNLILYSKFL